MVTNAAQAQKMKALRLCLCSQFTRWWVGRAHRKDECSSEGGLPKEEGLRWIRIITFSVGEGAWTQHN